MPKVLHLHVLPLISGSGINTFLTVQGLAKLGYEAHFACAPDGRLEDLVKENGIPFIPIRNLIHPIHPLKDLQALMEIYSILKKGGYDILHTHNSKGGILGRLAAKMAGTPLVIHTVHGFAFHEYESWWKRRLFITLEKIAAKLCHALIFISQPLMDMADRLKIGDRKNYFKIYSGIDIPSFQNGDREKIRREFSIAPGEKVIGVISKLWNGKGHLDLLRAFSILAREKSDMRLLLVGEGYLEDMLKREAERLHLGGRVIFTGFRYDIADITRAIDIAAVGSYFEGMGRVVLEAMACGKPVVATRVGGIPDLVEDQRTGILVTPGNIEEMAQAFRILANDAALSAEYGNQGKEKMAARKYSADFMVEEIHKVYQRLMNRGDLKIF